MTGVRVSGVVITLNEAMNIGRCIDSLAGVADEVLVVDSHSTDATRDIARAKGARVIKRDFDGYRATKAFAAAEAGHDVILSLDADEALSDELRAAVEAVRSDWSADGYAVNRLTSYCGRWLRHGGWYPDRQIRLWDRRRGGWQGGAVHERVVLQEGARVGRLEGDLLHYSFPTVESHLETMTRFSELAAVEAHQRGKRASLLHVVLNPGYTFLKKYLLQGGFLDGYRGFVACSLSARANYLKYTRLRALGRGTSGR